MTRTIRTCALVLALAAAAPAQQRAPCSVGAGGCEVEHGRYYLAFPDGWKAAAPVPLPALLFFHGHRSSGSKVVAGGGLRRAFGEAGYLLIAPDGAARADGVRGWPARPGGGRRDELAFIDAVLADVAGRLPLRRDRVLVSGFSSGGSMAWYMACYARSGFAGFVPVAGALRRPIPEHVCPAGPARLLHIHGFSDAQVPLEGRGIRDWHQGDVFEALALLRRTNACRSRPDRFETRGRLRCRIWDSCGSGRDVQFCLHDGGHGLPPGWSEQALRWFESFKTASQPPNGTN